MTQEHEAVDVRSNPDNLLQIVCEMRHEMRELRDDMRQEIEKLRVSEASRDGSARVWRTVGGVLVTVGLAGSGSAMALGMDASADHVTVNRHEAVIETMREDVTRIREDVAAMRAAMESR